MKLYSANILFVPSDNGIPVFGDGPEIPVCLMTLEATGGDEAADTVYDATRALFDLSDPVPMREIPEARSILKISDRYDARLTFVHKGVLMRKELERLLMLFAEDSHIGPRAIEQAAQFADPALEDLDTGLLPAKCSFWVQPTE